MYQSLLTRRYLTSKIMPLLAAAAVTLCVATELVVWSVMGGFLQTFVNMGRQLIGDVAISQPFDGIPHYQELIRKLQEDPEVVAATPTIETQGLLTMDQGRTAGVLVKGIDPASYDAVTKFQDTFWWKPIETPLKKDKKRQDPRLDEKFKALMENAREMGASMEWPASALTGSPAQSAAVMGVEVISKRGVRGAGGWIEIGGFTPGLGFSLSVMSQDRKGRTIDAATRSFVIGNEFKSGIYEVDANTVFVPLPLLQKMTRMDEAKKVMAGGDPYESGSTVVGVDPARVTSILVRGKNPDQSEALLERCAKVYEAFLREHPDAPANATLTTWRDRNAQMIGAVEKETVLVMFIFGIISLTSVFLVLSIFWSMVSEKTKDIGVLRAIGAGRSGVAWLWIRYGLTIGVVGSILGGAAAYLIVHNINAIHDWLGAALGISIWDPKVYYFSEIPSKIDWMKFVIIMTAGVVASVLGAMIPAVKAARMDPVKALRFE